MTETFVTNTDGNYIIEKDPNAILDYTFDWSEWLTDIVDTIAGTPILTLDVGLTKVSQSNTTTSVTTFISGGSAGSTYAVACKITTVGGRTDERTFYIKVVNK